MRNSHTNKSVWAAPAGRQLPQKCSSCGHEAHRRQAHGHALHAAQECHHGGVAVQAHHRHILQRQRALGCAGLEACPWLATMCSPEAHGGRAAAVWGQETQPLSCQGHPGKLPTCTGRGIRQRGTPGCSILRPAWGKRHAQPATPCPHVPARTRAASRPDLQHVEAAGGQGINAHLGVALVCVELLHQFRRRRGCRRERQGRAGEWERASNAVCSPSLQAHTPLASQARRAGAANQRRPALIVATSCMFLYHLSIHPCPHSLRSSITHSSPTAPPPRPPQEPLAADTHLCPPCARMPSAHHSGASTAHTLSYGPGRTQRWCGWSGEPAKEGAHLRTNW